MPGSLQDDTKELATLLGMQVGMLATPGRASLGYIRERIKKLVPRHTCAALEADYKTKLARANNNPALGTVWHAFIRAALEYVRCLQGNGGP